MRPNQHEPRSWRLTARQAGFLTVIAVVLAANAAFFLYFRHTDASPSHLGYGMRFPRTDGLNLLGGSVSWKDRWALVGFSDAGDADGIRHIKYAASLAERFEREGLVSVGVLHGQLEATDREFQLDGLKRSLIWDDGEWAKVLSMEDILEELR